MYYGTLTWEFISCIQAAIIYKQYYKWLCPFLRRNFVSIDFSLKYSLDKWRHICRSYRWQNHHDRHQNQCILRAFIIKSHTKVDSEYKKGQREASKVGRLNVSKINRVKLDGPNDWKSTVRKQKTGRSKESKIKGR